MVAVAVGSPAHEVSGKWGGPIDPDALQILKA
jgi:hypothetical protein